MGSTSSLPLKKARLTRSYGHQFTDEDINLVQFRTCLRIVLGLEPLTEDRTNCCFQYYEQLGLSFLEALDKSQKGV